MRKKYRENFIKYDKNIARISSNLQYVIKNKQPTIALFEYRNPKDAFSSEAPLSPPEGGKCQRMRRFPPFGGTKAGLLSCFATFRFTFSYPNKFF